MRSYTQLFAANLIGLAVCFKYSLIRTPGTFVSTTNAAKAVRRGRKLQNDLSERIPSGSQVLYGLRAGRYRQLPHAQPTTHSGRMNI
jgi:hypothetical protein